MASSSPHRWWRHHWRVIGATVVTAIMIPIALEWSGVMDIRPFAWVSAPPASASESEHGRLLTPNSPVKVHWTGAGDALDLLWSPMNYPGLHEYSVDVYGLSPVETWYNVGYRFGEELRTSATTYPVSLTNEQFVEKRSAERVTKSETWRVCVTGMRKTPGGVDITPYIIKGSKRCSDPFIVP